MEIRFDGTLADPSAPFLLPLTFRSSSACRAHSDAHAEPAVISIASLLGVLALAAGAVGDHPIERNAAAEVLVERGGELGIPFERAARAATSEASVAFSEAGTIAWLESQLGIPDESIGEPPKALKQYLEESKAALEAIVSALEREAPDWGRDEVDKNGTVNTPALTPSIRLQSVLLAAALVETRAGREIEAERLLEASWSLARPAAEAPLLITQLIAVRSGGWQAGVLRKMRSAPLAWIDRFSSDRSWSDMLDAYASDGEPQGISEPGSVLRPAGRDRAESAGRHRRRPQEARSLRGSQPGR